MQTQNQSADILALNNISPLVEVKKTIDAAPDDIFKAFSNPELIKQWWGPKGLNCPSAKTEFRVGGTYLFCMQSDDGEKVIWSTGKYLDIQTDQKIVCTTVPSNSKGEVLPSTRNDEDGPFADVGESTFTIELELSPVGDTELSLRHEGLPARMHDGCVEGWSTSLDKLKNLMEKQ